MKRFTFKLNYDDVSAAEIMQHQMRNIRKTVRMLLNEVATAYFKELF
jgi:hypothetical protein